jgi:hypothetical protein
MKPSAQLDSFSTPNEEDYRKVKVADLHIITKTIEDMRERATAMELVVSYANDLVKMWPTVTMRTLGTVTKKIADLKEALELAKR